MSTWYQKPVMRFLVLPEITGIQRKKSPSEFYAGIFASIKLNTISVSALVCCNK
jgi:hypothetical protein